MPMFLAFLRAINGGGHTVKMDHLRRLFASMGFSSVETFIASGNVVFKATSMNTRLPEKQIEHALREALGYEVATFIRTPAELAAIALCSPFQQSDLNAARALNIAFLTERLGDEAKQRVIALRTEVDDFAVHGREVYWLCRKKQSESSFSNAVFENAVGRQSTFRCANTMKKMATKYAPSES